MKRIALPTASKMVRKLRTMRMCHDSGSVLLLVRQRQVGSMLLLVDGHIACV